MRIAGDFHHLGTNFHIHKAVTVIISTGRRQDFWGDTATPSRDHKGGPLEIRHLLQMRVAADVEIHPIVGLENMEKKTAIAISVTNAEKAAKGCPFREIQQMG